MTRVQRLIRLAQLRGDLLAATVLRARLTGSVSYRDEPDDYLVFTRRLVA